MWSNVGEKTLEGSAFVKEAEDKVALIRKSYWKLRVGRRVMQITGGENSDLRKETSSTSRSPRCVESKGFK
jgi:hypothetical protein